MSRHSELSRTARRAFRQVAAGKSANVLAVVNSRGVLSVVTPGGTTHVMTVAARQGVDPVAGAYELVVQQTSGHQSVLASGTLSWMEALREALAAQMIGSPRGRRARWLGLLAACSALAFGAGLLAGTPSLPAGALQGRQNGSAPPFPVPGMPAPTGNLAGGTEELSRRLSEALAKAKPAEPGSASHTDNPVSLDDPAGQGTHPAPAAAAASGALAPATDTRPTPAPAPAAPLPATPPPPVPHAEAPSAPPAPGAATDASLQAGHGPAQAQAGQAAAAVPPPESTPSPPPAAAPEAIDQDSAQKLLAALHDLKAAALRGDKVTPDMLAGLPPDVADRLRASLSQDSSAAAARTASRQSLDPQTFARSRTDPYGISDIPEQNSWAATGGNVVIQLPGGGDIKTPDDLKRFGVEP